MAGRQRRYVRVPTSFDPNFLDRLGSDSLFAAAVIETAQAITTDLGGTAGLSNNMQTLIRKLAFLKALSADIERRIVAGAHVDLDHYVLLVNTILGLARAIGLERRQKPLRSLRQVMDNAA